MSDVVGAVVRGVDYDNGGPSSDPQQTRPEVAFVTDGFINLFAAVPSLVVYVLAGEMHLFHGLAMCTPQTRQLVLYDRAEAEPSAIIVTALVAIQSFPLLSELKLVMVEDLHVDPTMTSCAGLWSRPTAACDTSSCRFMQSLRRPCLSWSANFRRISTLWICSLSASAAMTTTARHSPTADFLTVSTTFLSSRRLGASDIAASPPDKGCYTSAHALLKRYGSWWLCLKLLSTARSRPPGLSGSAFLRLTSARPRPTGALAFLFYHPRHGPPLPLAQGCVARRTSASR